MKLFFLLASLLAVAQAKLAVRALSLSTPSAPSQNVTVQIIVPIDTSSEAGEEEVSLAIGIIACGSSSCPLPSADLGEILFIGQYQPQGSYDPLDTFENFTFGIPSDISGQASIQVQHVYVTTPPGHAYPTIEYASAAIQIA